MRQLASASLTLALLWPQPADAQTWVGGRTTPVIGEIFAIDATGETGWLYGFEDLAGDGQDFKQPEQSIDIRTAYAATDAARFWARVYVSDPNSAGGNVTMFVFIDSDQSAATGGDTAATEVNARFVSDSTNGGFEYILEVSGNATVDNVWEWGGAQFQVVNLTPNQAAAEAGQDADPIAINGVDHGYIQGMVDLDVVGLTQACDANLYVRSVIGSGSGDGDLEVGTWAPCIPVDGNSDGVPDVLVEVEEGCTADAQCPFGGICVGGSCIVPQHCFDSTDCDPGEECSPDDICIPLPAGPCSDSSTCGDLVCKADLCSPCTPGSSECGAGRICAPDGRCVTGTPGGGAGGGGADELGLEPGDHVKGGALTCAWAAGDGSRAALSALALCLAGLALRRRRGERR